MTGINRRIGIWMAGIVCVATAIVVPSMLVAQDQPAAAPAAAKRPQPDMRTMGGAFRTLNAQIKDATKNESSLALLAQMEAAGISAKDAVPPMLASLPDAEKNTKLAEYKKGIIKLLRQELDAEEALLSGDNAKAAEILAAMNATQQEGHRGFRPARGGGGGGGGNRGGAQ